MKLKHDVLGSATFSSDMQYRFFLTRQILDKEGIITWIMMNPSIGTEDIDEMSVAKITRISRKMGYGLINVVNTFPLIATDQEKLVTTKIPEKVMERNFHYILTAVKQADCVVAAYGKPKTKSLQKQGLEVVKALLDQDIKINVLALTKDGIPRHPRFLSESSIPKPWNIDKNYVAQLLLQC